MKRGEQVEGQCVSKGGRHSAKGVPWSEEHWFAVEHLNTSTASLYPLGLGFDLFGSSNETMIFLE